MRSSNWAMITPSSSFLRARARRKKRQIESAATQAIDPGRVLAVGFDRQQKRRGRLNARTDDRGFQARSQGKGQSALVLDRDRRVFEPHDPAALEDKGFNAVPIHAGHLALQSDP